MIPSYKVVLIGSTCGKSSLLKRIRENTFNPIYNKTLGVDVIPLTFNTNYGTIILKIWDCSTDNHCNHAEGAICMFDLSCMLSFDNLDVLIRRLQNIAGDIPLVICGNKCELKNQEVNPNKMIAKDILYFNISVKDNINCLAPFLQLLRQLTGNIDLEFV